jgi:hypothetical protein
MHKLALAIATVFVVAISAAGIASGVSGPVVVDEGFDCNIFDGNGDLFVTTDSQVIFYESTGKVVLRCQGTGAAAPSLIHFNFGNTGLSCGIPGYGATTDWDNKVGRSGHSQLTCTTFVEAANSASSGAAGIAG